MYTETVVIGNKTIRLCRTADKIYYAAGSHVLNILHQSASNVLNSCVTAGLHESDYTKLGAKPVWYVTHIGLIQLVNFYGVNESLFELAEAMEKESIDTFRKQQRASNAYVRGSSTPKKTKKIKNKKKKKTYIPDEIYMEYNNDLITYSRVK